MISRENFQKIILIILKIDFIGEREVTLTVNGKSFSLNLSSMHEIREDSGTARPIQRQLTSQLQQNSGSNENEINEEHLELTAQLTKLLLPVLLEVYSNSAGPGVRHNCIQALLRMVQHTPDHVLKECIHVSLVSSQVAGKNLSASIFCCIISIFVDSLSILIDDHG